MVVGGGISGSPPPTSSASGQRASCSTTTTTSVATRRATSSVGGRPAARQRWDAVDCNAERHSPQARGLLTALGIDPPALIAQGIDQQLFAGLKSAVFFNKQTFGEDHQRSWIRQRGAEFSPTPLSHAAQRDIERLLQEAPIDYLPGLSSADKKDRLSRISYKDFLLHIVKASMSSRSTRRVTHGLYGVGIDAVPAR